MEVDTKEETERIYQDQAKSYSYAALSIGIFNENESKDAWQAAHTKTFNNHNIITATQHKLEFSTRALIASVFV